MILLYRLLKNMIALLIFGKDIKTIAIGKTFCGHDYIDFIQCVCGRKSFMIRSDKVHLRYSRGMGDLTLILWLWLKQDQVH